MIFSLPWNQNTFVGWLGMLFCATIASMVYFLLNSIFLSLFASICEFHQAFYMNFDVILNKLSQEINAKKVEYHKVQLILIEFIQNSIKGKE